MRGLERREVLEVLDRALDAVPAARLARVAGSRMPLEELAPDDDLLGQIEAFCRESYRGKFYRPFDVNWKNSTQKSRGTERWIAECQRLFKRCVKEAAGLELAQLHQALKALMDLLREVDGGSIEIVFWADEGGSYEVHVEWEKVLPLWFRCLASTSTPEEYAREVMKALKDFFVHDRSSCRKKALSLATPAQRAALAAALRPA